MTDFVGTPGDDTIQGTNGNDYFDLSQGGDDSVFGGQGNDVFYMGGAFTDKDFISGGLHYDTLELDGDYSGGVRLRADGYGPWEINDVQFDAGHDYVIRLYGAAERNNPRFLSDLGADDHMVLNASRVTEWGVHYESLAGHETIIGSAQTDDLQLRAGLDAEDRINAGGGYDWVTLDGDYSAGVVFTNQTLRHVERLQLGSGSEGNFYDLTLAKNTVDDSGMMIYGETMRLDGSKSLGPLTVHGGDGKDEIIGGHAADHILSYRGQDRVTGGGGGDTIEGGRQGDRFIYQLASDSVADAPDLITDMDRWDAINLKHIDADTTISGDQAFYLAAALDGHAGELVLSYDAGSGITSIMGDVDGDGQADLVIHASGDRTDFTRFVL